MARLSRSILIALACWFAVPACVDLDLQSREGRRLLRQGKFDAALERFSRASLSRPKDPALLANLGLVLSLKAVSQPEAVRALEASVSRKLDDAVLLELLLLYLHLGLHAEAIKLLGPDRIPVERYFRPEMVALQAGTACMAEPGARTLASLQRHAAGEAGLYFLARCSAAAGQADAARKAFTQIQSAELRCRLVADVPELFNQPPGPPPSGKTAGGAAVGSVAPDSPLANCRARFPGLVHIFRDRPRLPPKGKPTLPARKLFQEEFEFPPYAEDHWRYQSGS